MSTWGQIAILLTKSTPGVDPELIFGFLNRRYEQILEAADWEGVREDVTIETVAAYQSSTDTAAWTNGSAALTLTGFTPDPSFIGRKIYRPGDTMTYVIQDIVGSVLTLDRPYEQGTNTSGAYVMFQDVYTLPVECRVIVKDSVINPVNGRPMVQLSRLQLARSAGTPATIGDPSIYITHGDSDPSLNPIFHEIQFYPPPTKARGIPLQLVRTGLGFDGDNTSDSPFPWISDTVLNEGAEADICAYLAKQNPAQAGAYLALAKAHEGKYQEEKATLLRIEFQQRRAPVRLQMASRFQRHRLARATRGYGTSWRGGRPGGPD